MNAYKITYKQSGEIFVSADSFTIALDKFFSWYVKKYNDINYNVRNIEIVGEFLEID